MTAQPMQDILRGMTMEEAHSEYIRLCFRAEQLTVSLRQLVMTSVVRASVERERDEVERSAFDLECRIAEVEARQHARGAA